MTGQCCSEMEAGTIPLRLTDECDLGLLGDNTLRTRLKRGRSLVHQYNLNGIIKLEILHPGYHRSSGDSLLES